MKQNLRDMVIITQNIDSVRINNSIQLISYAPYVGILLTDDPFGND